MLMLDEFRKLSEEEKAKRYCELTDHERFLWGISCPITPRVVKNSELTPQELEYVTHRRKEALEKGEITQEEFDELQYSEPQYLMTTISGYEESEFMCGNLNEVISEAGVKINNGTLGDEILKRKIEEVLKYAMDGA